MKALPCGGIACLDELRDVLDLMLPVVEGKVDVVAHLLNHRLHRCWLAYHLHLLTTQVLNSTLYTLHLTTVSFLFILCMETDNHLKYFVVPKESCLFCELFF